MFSSVEKFSSRLHSTRLDWITAESAALDLPLNLRERHLSITHHIFPLSSSLLDATLLLLSLLLLLHPAFTYADVRVIPKLWR